MNKSWHLIEKILKEEKTIESRWYQTRRLPWDRIKTGDRVFFKNSGEPITAMANVGAIYQFEFNDITDVYPVLKKYGQQICLVEPDPLTWKSKPRYAVLIELKHPTAIQPPFNINKNGFGSATAWITVEDIETIRLS